MPTGQKFIHKVDSELSGDAQYRTYGGISASALNIGSTIEFSPGVYEMGSVNVDGIHFRGVGAREEVILANMVLGASSANTITFTNLTLSGNSPAAASTARSLFVTNGSTATLRFRDVRFITGDFAVDNQSEGSMYFFGVDATGVDRAFRANAASTTEVAFSSLNGSSNAYFTGANAVAKAVITIASYSGGSNTGNTTETVRALIS